MSRYDSFPITRRMITNVVSVICLGSATMLGFAFPGFAATAAPAAARLANVPIPDNSPWP